MEYELLQLINLLGVGVVGMIIAYHFIGLDDQDEDLKLKHKKE
jgi:hypothetical protein